MSFRMQHSHQWYDNLLGAILYLEVTLPDALSWHCYHAFGAPLLGSTYLLYLTAKKWPDHLQK
jgi:hypothetical protein